eukprot:gene10429-11549_t
MLEVREENVKEELQQYQAKQEGSVQYGDEEFGEVTKGDSAKEMNNGNSEVLHTAMQQAHEKLLCHAEDSDARATTLLHLCLLDLVLDRPLLHGKEKVLSLYHQSQWKDVKPVAAGSVYGRLLYLYLRHYRRGGSEAVGSGARGPLLWCL